MLTIALALAGCVKPAPPAMTPDTIVTYATSDGWEMDLRRYPGPEGAPPVLLVHGMGANHYNWDYAPEISLAHHLQAAGWDVWIPALRGDPGSVPPEKRADQAFTFDDYARLDLPAAVDRVLEITGREQLS